MNTIGDVMSMLFDKQFVEKAQGYSKLFDSWEDITKKNGLPSAFAHSRIKDLDKGILKIEMDHPGWKQILQTKQSELLNDFIDRFPEMDISGISFMLGYSENELKPKSEEKPEEIQTVETSPPVEPVVVGFDAIKDNDFKNKLMSISAAINEKEKNNVRRD